jgi:hypothetical protein
LAKFTDQELIKSIERLNNAEGKNSFINYWLFFRYFDIWNYLIYK